MKFYITKYALTRGIIEAHGRILNDCSTMIKLIDSDIDYVGQPFWHVRKEDAIEHALNMRERKIKNLRKQIERLEDLKFK